MYINIKYYTIKGNDKIAYHGGNRAKATAICERLNTAGDRAAHVYKVNGDDGRFLDTHLYVSRKWAQKAVRGGEIVVKVCGGWRVMDAQQAQIWSAQV